MPKKIVPLKTEFRMIDASKVLPNPEQPRTDFDETELNNLANSIKQHGVIKPIEVESVGEEFILHDGERRLRAAIKAGLQLIPAMVRDTEPGTETIDRLTRALVANIQAEQMHPVDDALAVRRLRDEFGLNNRKISIRISKSEAWVGSRLALADLEPEIQQLMREKKMTSEADIVRALNKIGNSKEKVAFARKLADNKATGKIIKQSVNNYINLKTAKQSESTIAIDLTEKIEKRYLPEWDALYQLGRVPPWPVVNDATAITCKECALRPVASPDTCGSCALPAFLKFMLESIHASKSNQTQ